MPAKLVPQFTKQQIRTFIQKRIDAFHAAILMRLKFVGERFIALAKDNANFKDQTGNLRSSIGYVISKDGEIIFRTFPFLRTGAVEAVAKAVEEAFGKIGNKSGYALIGIAGMHYAIAVESKGYDVLTGSGQIAAELLKKSIKELEEKLKRQPG